MWSAVTTITPPDAEPVSVDDARAQCRLGDDTTLDPELTRYIKAARAWVESYTGTRLVTQTVTFSGDGFGGLARLPVGPLQSIVSITAGGALLEPGTYDDPSAGIYPSISVASGSAWPSLASGGSIAVDAVAGYGAAADVPDDLKHAILMLAASMYDNRGHMPEETQASARVFCGPHKRWGV